MTFTLLILVVVYQYLIFMMSKEKLRRIEENINEEV